jgi:hypothetical protein
MRRTSLMDGCPDNSRTSCAIAINMTLDGRAVAKSIVTHMPRAFALGGL